MQCTSAAAEACIIHLLQINPRTSLLWCAKAAAILATWAASFYCTFFLEQSFVVRSTIVQLLLPYLSGIHQA